MFPPEKTHPKDFEVMDEVLRRGDAQELSRILSCSAQLIRDWCREPAADGTCQSTGRYSPLSRIRALIGMISEDDGCHGRAHPIGHYVARLLGGLFVPMQHKAVDPSSELFGYISGVLKETAEAVESARIAWCEKTPGRVSSREAVSIRRECEEAMAALQMIIQWVNKQDERNGTQESRQKNS